MMTQEQFRSAQEQQSKMAQELKKDNDKTASMAGAGAGVIAGAQLGTVVLPIPVVGTFTGALVGGLIGTKIGKKVGGVLLDKITPVEKSFCQGTSSGVSDVTKELERLAQLKEAGVITEDEFKAAKARLLGL